MYHWLHKILRESEHNVDLKVNSNKNVAIVITFNIPSSYQSKLISISQLSSLVQNLLTGNHEENCKPSKKEKVEDDNFEELNNSYDWEEPDNCYDGDIKSLPNVSLDKLNNCEESNKLEIVDNPTVINIKKTKKPRWRVSCKTCGERLSKRAFKNHDQVCSPSNPFSTEPIPCDECGLSFTKKSYLRNHKIRVHSQAQLFCDKCDYVATNRLAYNKHLQRIHSKTRKLFTCDLCGKTLFSSNKAKHMLNYHETRELSSCQLCGAQVLDIKAHMRRKHEKSHQCPHCSYKAGTTFNLKLHVNKVHLGMKEFEKFTCPHCNVQTMNLEIHIRNQHPENYLQSV